MIFSRLSGSYLYKDTHLLLSVKPSLLPVKHRSLSNQSLISDTVNKDGSYQNEKESNWNGKNAWKFGLMSLSAMSVSVLGFAISTWGPPKKNLDGNEITDKFSQMNIFWGYTCRAFSEILALKDSIKDPVSDKLLPDPLEHPYFQPKYTLVIEAKDVLVHPDWKFRTGWRFKKRPALEMFLQQLYPYYEVVCFTSEGLLTMGPVIQQLDSKGELIHYRLFRESTRYRGGVHIKDLSCLNRDLSKVILVDCSKEAAKLQRNNALILKPWDGDDSDRDLIDLAAFLRMIAMSGVEDVRPALENYMQDENPLALFRERHQKLMDLEAEKKREAHSKNRFSHKKLPFSGFQ